MKARLSSLEDLMKENEKYMNEIKYLSEKLNIIEKKNLKLEKELRKALEHVKVREIIVKEATEAVIAIFFKKQYEMKKGNECKNCEKGKK